MTYTLKNGHIRHSKITRYRSTDGPTDGLRTDTAFYKNAQSHLLASSHLIAAGGPLPLLGRNDFDIFAGDGVHVSHVTAAQLNPFRRDFASVCVAVSQGENTCV